MAVPGALATTAIQTTTFNLAPGQSNESWSSNGTSSGNGVLTLSFSNPALGTITLTGYSCTGQTFCNAVPTTQEPTAALTDSAGAVGMLNGTSEAEIPRNNFVTIDFSNFHASITSVTIGLTNIVDGWDIYSTGVKNELDSSPVDSSQFNNQPAPVAQGNNDNNGGASLTTYITTSNSSFSTSTTGSSTLKPTTNFLTVTALQNDCDVEIGSISVSYAPEPTTLVLMGGALLGLGIAGKKLRRRS
jgi:hypothetical protein